MSKLCVVPVLYWRAWANHNDSHRFVNHVLCYECVTESSALGAIHDFCVCSSSLCAYSRCNEIELQNKVQFMANYIFYAVYSRCISATLPYNTVRISWNGFWMRHKINTKIHRNHVATDEFQWTGGVFCLHINSLYYSSVSSFTHKLINKRNRNNKLSGV